MNQPERANRSGDQPLPTPNDTPSIQSLVRADLDQREQLGIQRYGTPLQAHNGRDALRDAYEEAQDLTCYLRQLLEERRNPAFLVIQTMQERIANRDAELQRRADLITELRKQLDGAIRLAERHGAQVEPWTFPEHTAPTPTTPEGTPPL